MLVGLIALAGCGGHDKAAAPQDGSTEATTSTSATPGTTAGSTSTRGTASTATTTAAPSTTATTGTTVSSSTITLSDGDSGRTITAHRGDVLAIVLHSTYWSFTTPASAVVHPEGPASVVPDLHGCVPGGGCGTAAIRYRAVAVGSATLSAHRDTCGEALACTGSQGEWHVTVHVST